MSELAARAIGAVIAFFLIAIALWWVGDSIVTAIRAPVVAERDLAVTANQSLVASNAELAASNRQLSATIARRGKREDGIDRRLTGMEQGLKGLKGQSPEVKAWAETPIPPEVLK